jgi:hypothetical protein
MTPNERRRAVEVMARAAWNRDADIFSSDGKPITWSRAPYWQKKPYVWMSDDALTALLTIADVTMKETKDG